MPLISSYNSVGEKRKPWLVPDCTRRWPTFYCSFIHVDSPFFVLFLFWMLLASGGRETGRNNPDAITATAMKILFCFFFPFLFYFYEHFLFFRLAKILVSSNCQLNQLHAKTVGTQQLVKNPFRDPESHNVAGRAGIIIIMKKGISLCQKIWHNLINKKKREVPFLLPGIPQLLGNRIFKFLNRFIHFRVNSTVLLTLEANERNLLVQSSYF